MNPCHVATDCYYTEFGRFLKISPHLVIIKNIFVKKKMAVPLVLTLSFLNLFRVKVKPTKIFGALKNDTETCSAKMLSTFYGFNLHKTFSNNKLVK